MNFTCQKLTSQFDTGVTHFNGQNVISETIPITLKLRSERSVTFISWALLPIRLSLSFRLELVHLCKDCRNGYILQRL